MPANSPSPAPEVDNFWVELSACDHCVQFYDSDAAFLDALEGFALGGFQQGDAIIVIATSAHRHSLEARLAARGIDLGAAIERDQYMALDAASALGQLMDDGWPGQAQFESLVASLLARGHKHHGKVRAFGEMVALLWAKGQCDAALRLEHMWGQLCRRDAFSLFCAYPQTGFVEDITFSMDQICSAHSKVYVL